MLFDTAFTYRNEAEIGDVLKEIINSGKVKREDFFITTKVGLTCNGCSQIDLTIDNFVI